jgi:hypothetical protein
MPELEFDPEKVERYSQWSGWSDTKCVSESDYDVLLALYREAIAERDSIELGIAMLAKPLLPPSEGHTPTPLDSFVPGKKGRS